MSTAVSMEKCTHTQSNRPHLTSCSQSAESLDPDDLTVSTVTAEYKSRLPSPPSAVPAAGSFPSTDGEERMEIEGKAIGLPTPTQNIKTLIRSYRAFPSKSRQTMAIAGISFASLLALLLIFCITRSIQGNGSEGSAVMTEHQVTKELDIKIQSDEYQGQDRNEKSEYDTSQNFKVFKSAGGKVLINGKDDESLGVQSHNPSLPPAQDEPPEDGQNDWHFPSDTDISKVLDIVRKNIDGERKTISNKELRMWIPGAEQLRVLLVSTWRSGADYLSQMLQAYPGIFQHYEPLSYIGPRQVRSGKEAFQAQQVVHRLLDCNYENLDNYMNYTKTHLRDTIGHNERVWKSCEAGESEMTCGDPGFLSTACQMFPIQLVKTARLRLNLTHLLLNDQKLHVKVLFMVRDPRGVMNSRLSKVNWCLSSSDCSSAEALCRDMQGDLKVASAFEKLYPDRFLKVRYEDLLGNTETEVTKIMSFLNLEISKVIRKFLKENPVQFYDSQDSAKANRIPSWKRDLPVAKISEIQNACSDVLKELNYNIIGS